MQNFFKEERHYKLAKRNRTLNQKADQRIHGVPRPVYESE